MDRSQRSQLSEWLSQAHDLDELAAPTLKFASIQYAVLFSQRIGYFRRIAECLPIRSHVSSDLLVKRMP